MTKVYPILHCYYDSNMNYVQELQYIFSRRSEAENWIAKYTREPWFYKVVERDLEETG